MSDVSLDPYLFFSGNAKEALEFYKGIFGGELDISTFGDAPPMPGMEDVDKSSVMHGMLSGGAVKLMASDSQKASPEAKKIELSLSGEDEATLRKYWDGLAEGAKVTMPLAKAPWGDTFGMLTDKFAISWMVNIAAKK